VIVYVLVYINVFENVGSILVFPLPLGSGFTYKVNQAFGWPSGNPRDAVLIFTHF
jgi:hypothetical protein